MDEQYGQLIEPAPVKFAFGAPAWYVLAGLLLLILSFAAWLLWRYYQRNKYRTKAVKQLTALQQSLSGEGAYDTLVYETNMLIKCIAMAKYGRSAVAGTRGKIWIDYLNSVTKVALFDNKDETLLHESIYTTIPTSADDAMRFSERARVWVRKHKRKKIS